jgi:hypothetical protein
MSVSWLRPVCGGFHNLIRFNCAPFFASCRRYRVLTVICLDACWYAAYLTVKTWCLRHEAKKGAQLKRMRLWKPPHTGLSHDADVSFCFFCLMSWCLSWSSWCAAALKQLSSKIASFVCVRHTFTHMALSYLMIFLPFPYSEKRMKLLPLYNTR